MTSFRVTVPFLRGPYPSSSVVGVAGLENLFGNYGDARPKQELLPHLSEARTAKFSVKHVEYNRHDRTPRFDHRRDPLYGICGIQEVN
jgi:hypothetical protein